MSTRFSTLGGSLFDLAPPPFSLACDPTIFNFPSGKNLLACDPEKIDPPKSICITLRTTVRIIFKYAFQPKTWLVHEIFTCNDSYRTHVHLLHRYTYMYMVCLYILFVNTYITYSSMQNPTV